MPYRPQDIYKGRRKYRTPLMAALLILAILLALFLFLFFYLQRYLVYSKDGVSLVMPNEQAEEIDTAEQTQSDGSASGEIISADDIEIVYDNADLSLVDNGTHDELADTRLLYVSYDDVTDLSVLSSAISQAEDENYTGLLLQMKGRSGRLAWASTSETAAAYDSAGTMDFTDVLAQIHDAGLTAAAQISCCIDELLSERNWTVTLQDADGSSWQDDDGYAYLDPYNHTVRSYVCEMVEELAGMGFDEIVLADLIHPDTEDELTYTVSLMLAPDPVTAVCQMAQQAVQALPEDSTAVVSVLISENSLSAGSSTRTGQDIDVFWRLFARLYCPISEGTAADDLEAAWSYANGGDSAARFVPVCSFAPDGFSSYCIKNY